MKKVLLSAFLLLAPAAYADPHLDCSQFPTDRNTVVVIDINNQAALQNSVVQAARDRGENVAAFPLPGSSGRVDNEMIYSMLDELKRCHAKMDSLVVAGHDGGGYYWGGPQASGFSHDDLMTALRHYSSVTKTLRSTYFWGCNSNARGTLLGIYRPSYAGRGGDSTSWVCGDDACKNHQGGFDPFYRGAFPVSTTWGDDQSALNNDNPIATHYLYLLMTQENSINQIADANTYLAQMNQIRCQAATQIGNPRCEDPRSAAAVAATSQVSISGANNGCYYHLVTDNRGLHGKIEVSDLSETPSVAFCKNELSTFDGKLLAPLLSASKGCDEDDCSDNNPADMRDIPDDTSHGKLREVYEYFYGDSDCQRTADPLVAAQFPNVNFLRDLLFYNHLRNAIAANHATELNRMNSDLVALGRMYPPIDLLTASDLYGGCGPGQKVCAKRTLTRAGLLDKLRTMRQEIEANESRFQKNAVPAVLNDLDFLASGFYQLLTLEPFSTFTSSKCQSKSTSNESCLLNAMIPPGWAEEANQRSPIFDHP